MSETRLGVIMHGVTGRVGTNRHLIRSVLAIRDQGGVVPDPILVGRNADRVEALACAHGGQRWTTDMDAALAGLGMQSWRERRWVAVPAVEV